MGSFAVKFTDNSLLNGVFRYQCSHRSESSIMATDGILLSSYDFFGKFNLGESRGIVKVA